MAVRKQPSAQAATEDKQIAEQQRPEASIEPITEAGTAPIAEATNEAPAPLRSAIVELPVAEICDANFGLRFDTRLTARQSNALRRIAAGIERRRETPPDVSGNVSTSQALRFVLERLADSMGLPI